MGQPQLLERRAEHIFDDHRLPPGGDRYPFGAQGAVRRVPQLPVQRGHRPDNLSNQAEGGIDVGPEAPLLG